MFLLHMTHTAVSMHTGEYNPSNKCSPGRSHERIDQAIGYFIFPIQLHNRVGRVYDKRGQGE